MLRASQSKRFPSAASHVLAYAAAILLVLAAHLAVGAQAALMFA